MELYQPPAPAAALAGHRRTARSRLAFYAAVSVRGTELANGEMELTYHLHTIDGPGRRLQTVLLGSDPEACRHITCGLGRALDLVRGYEQDVIKHLEEEPDTQLTFPW